MTESFGQLVIQGILLIRFDWLVKKDDFNSFGLNFQVFVVASMCVAFFTMVKAVLAYHNRNRESLRPMFSFSNLSTVTMFIFILVAKVIVYIVGFQNTPGLFFVPVVVKILASWILLNTFEPEFRSLLAHERMTYVLVSFLAPISIPCKDKKKMGKTYGISLFLFLVEGSSIILYAVLIKRYYHFHLFRKFYDEFPKLLQLDQFSFETLAILLLLVCFIAFLIASMLSFLATKSFHPTNSLFKSKNPENTEERDIREGERNEAFALELFPSEN